MKAVISLLVCLVSPGQAHVSLKYPPARHIDLDFLDSFRTSGDCGVEAGDSRTSLLAGSQLNLTWHLGYPHGGGYRLELVEGSQARLLVPPTGDESSFQTLGGVTAQSSVVTLPDVECEECYLRFQRQATEWGRNYKFRSCADIRLVRGLSDGERCSGEGSWDGGRCRCNRLRLGDRCQYQTQCQDDGVRSERERERETPHLTISPRTAMDRRARVSVSLWTAGYFPTPSVTVRTAGLDLSVSTRPPGGRARAAASTGRSSRRSAWGETWSCCGE